MQSLWNMYLLACVNQMESIASKVSSMYQRFFGSYTLWIFSSPFEKQFRGSLSSKVYECTLYLHESLLDFHEAVLYRMSWKRRKASPLKNLTICSQPWYLVSRFREKRREKLFSLSFLTSKHSVLYLSLSTPLQLNQCWLKVSSMTFKYIHTKKSNYLPTYRCLPWLISSEIYQLIKCFRFDCQDIQCHRQFQERYHTWVKKVITHIVMASMKFI
jgi:hypothetical protein